MTVVPERIAKHFEYHNLTLVQLQEWFLCTSRPTIVDGTNCDYCDGSHPYAEDYIVDPNGYWSEKRQWHALKKFYQSATKGKVAGFESMTWLTDFEIDSEYCDTTLFDPQSGLSREQLFQWYVCGRKTSYGSHEAAQKNSVRVEEGIELSVYPCFNHGEDVRYHLGHGNQAAAMNTMTFRRARRAWNIYTSAGKAHYGCAERISK